MDWNVQSQHPMIYVRMEIAGSGAEAPFRIHMCGLLQSSVSTNSI